MGAKKKFYTTMVAVILLFFGRAIVVSMDQNRRENLERLKFVETLTYEQCAERFEALRKEFQVRPATGRAYYTTLRHAYALINSAQKAMENPPPTWTAGKRRDFRIDDVVRSIPVDIQGDITQYVKDIGPIQDTQEFRDAGREFAESNSNPIHRPPVSVPGGERVLFWWLIFQFGPTPLVAIHFCIRLRAQGLKILPEFPPLNPRLLVWALFWEVGFFRYPMKISPREQLRRAQRWGVLVLSSVLPCMAGAGKTCEKKSEPAPQHQLYKGLWSHVSFSTNMLSEYLGLDGGRFFNAAVEQSSATVSLPCGFYIVGIDSEPVANRSARPNYGRELDGMVGWKRTFGNYSVDVSATYLDVVPLGILPRGDVVQFSERVTRRVSVTKRSTVSPYLWLRQAMPTRGPTPVGGNFVHGGATLSQSLSERVSASLALEVVHDSGAFGYRSGYIGRMVWGMNWKRGRGVSVQIPQVTVTDPLSHTHDGRHREVAVGVGITISPGH